MADEKTNEPASGAPAAETLEVSNEIIDLEGLVRDIDLTPTNAIGQKGTRGPASRASSVETSARNPVENQKAASDEQPASTESLSPEKFDELLLQEDPEMAARLESIRADGLTKVEGVQGLEPLDVSLETTFGDRVSFFLLKISNPLLVAKDFLVRIVVDSKKDFKAVLRQVLERLKATVIESFASVRASLKSFFGWFKSRTGPQRLALALAICGFISLPVIAMLTVRGQILPKVQKAWVANLADHADAVFTYDQTGPFEDFNDPLLHPEFVVLIERTVVNLRRTTSVSENVLPMAAFELYVQTDNQDAAVEIKDRNVEIRDTISRSVERMSYQDLVGEEGKAKLKLLLRKDINALITKGKVRRVFFKTIVLNPE